jgi:hypothetical protein
MGPRGAGQARRPDESTATGRPVPEEVGSMLKRLATLGLVVAALATAGCKSSSCVGCSSASDRTFLHCERPCYCRAFQKDARQIMDFVDIYLLNYDKHDPYRCDPCLDD